MTSRQIALAASMALLLGVTACVARRSQIIEAPQAEQPLVEPTVMGGSTAVAMPRAVVYKTNGNFNDNVPILLNASRTEVVAYPAPTDINDYSSPLQLTDGYLLDCRGISANSAFTRYTYADYSSLAAAPSAEKLMEMIIPGAEVVEMVVLPVAASVAMGDTALCNRYITQGFPDCRVVVNRRAIQLTPQ